MQLLHAAVHLLVIGLNHLAAQSFDLARRLRQMLHTLTQLSSRAATFFFAHVIQPLDSLLQRGGDVLL